MLELDQDTTSTLAELGEASLPGCRYISSSAGAYIEAWSRCNISSGPARASTTIELLICTEPWSRRNGQ